MVSFGKIHETRENGIPAAIAQQSPGKKHRGEIAQVRIPKT
jgi:hypothetical protein